VRSCRYASDQGSKWWFSSARAARRPQSFTAWRSAIATRHLHQCPGLIDEDELLKIELVVEPFLAPLRGVGAILLGSVLSFLPMIACSATNRHIVPNAT